MLLAQPISSWYLGSITGQRGVRYSPVIDKTGSSDGFVFCRLENLHRRLPPKIGGTALDRHSEDQAAPYAGSAASRDGTMDNCGQNKLMVSSHKRQSLENIVTVSHDWEAPPTYTHTPPWMNRPQRLVHLCLLCCRSSGEKKSLERKSSADMNGYQIRVWNCGSLLGEKIPGFHSLNFGEHWFGSLEHTLAYSQDAVKNRSPAALSPKNKCLIQLLAAVRCISWRWAADRTGCWQVFKKIDKQMCSTFRLLYNCSVLLTEHTTRHYHYCKRATGHIAHIHKASTTHLFGIIVL